MSKRVLAAAAAAALLGAGAAGAQDLSSADSFRIGTGASLLCTAQASLADPALAGMFDRGYAISCRDAAVPVGNLYELRTRDGDPAARLAGQRAARVSCAGAGSVEVEGLGAVETLDCRLNEADVGYRVYLKREGGRLYVAEGLAGYDSALRLGLRSLVANREVEGEVAIATTGAGDPAAFARVQAGTLDPDRAFAEAYRRNNAGAYAESAEYFASLIERAEGPAGRAEAFANEALQKSNLGRHGEADALFAQAEALGGTHPVLARRLRNYRAMHSLNRGLPDQALRVLARPIPDLAGDSVRTLEIDPPTAARLSAETEAARRLGIAAGLTDQDKAQLLDAQALQLQGTVLRLLGRDAQAAAPLGQALAALVAVREGRIAETVWMRAQIHGELAAIAEAEGAAAEAEAQHRAAIALLERDYPESAALLSARGRLAGYFARAGRDAEAEAMYRALVAEASAAGEASPAMRRILEPWLEMLAERGTDPQAAADLFAASQLLVRPGVAQTQAVLARELSGGSDEAARLFRQSVTLARDIERSRVERARLLALESPDAIQLARREALEAELERLGRDQAATQARLAEFPRYRVVANEGMNLAELQGLLAPGEAYYKMIVLGDYAYTLFVTPGSARAFRIAATPAELERRVDALRETITVVENGQRVTYPFDVELAHALYGTLFAPVAGELAGISHLIFEPDGAMLRLPPNLLVVDRAGVDAYLARAADPEDEGFDFRGIAWFGRDKDISTAVSARAFRDVRRAPPSRASAEYLGFGQNAPAQAFFATAAAGTRSEISDERCTFSLGAWNRPISADELYTARGAIAPGQPSQTEIVTGAAFSDTAIKGRDDLDSYRILHFATHGITDAPRPDCPARPSLLTSFGGPQSDGLLTFAEIFDLKLDADLVILSACDTASRASRAATAEAGLATGGDFALDGLVRAFVGAGGRMVVASHWPVPEDFNATQRLISGLFTADAGTSTAGALRDAQRALMDDAATSHPYYWSGFAVIGDGAVPVIRAPAQTAFRTAGGERIASR